MSRSGYSEDGDDDQGRQNLWRGTVTRAFNGKRGQAFFREMAAALDAMPVKELVTEEIVREQTGQVCAIGSVALARGLDVAALDPEDPDAVGKVFGISPTMVREITFVNDDDFSYHDEETPAARWKRVRGWVDAQIVKAET